MGDHNNKLWGLPDFSAIPDAARFYIYVPGVGSRNITGADLKAAISVAAGGSVAVLDKGTSLIAAVTSIDFVGDGVTASVVGSAVTVTIPGGGGGSTGPYIIADASNGLNYKIVSDGGVIGLEETTATAGTAPTITDATNGLSYKIISNYGQIGLEEI